jgi:hypothetical protein
MISNELPPQIAAWVDAEVNRYREMLIDSCRHYPVISRIIDSGGTFSDAARKISRTPVTAARVYRLGKGRGW